MTTSTSRHENASAERGATYATLAATAERSLYVMEAEGRNLELRRKSGERLTHDEAAALRALPDRLAQHRLALEALRARASIKS